MKNIQIFSNPYAMYKTVKTELMINDRVLTEPSSKLMKYVVQQEMSVWLYPYHKGLLYWKGLLRELVDELGDDEITFHFYGREYEFLEFEKISYLHMEEMKEEGTEIQLKIFHHDKWNSKLCIKELLSCLNSLKKHVITTRDELKEVSWMEEQLCTMPVKQCDQKEISDENKLLRDRRVRSDESLFLCIFPDAEETVENQFIFIDDAIKDNQNCEYITICYVLDKLSRKNDFLDRMKAKYESRERMFYYVAETYEEIGDILWNLYDQVTMPFIIPTCKKRIVEFIESKSEYSNNSYVLQILDELDCIG